MDFLFPQSWLKFFEAWTLVRKSFNYSFRGSGQNYDHGCQTRFRQSDREHLYMFWTWCWKFCFQIGWTLGHSLKNCLYHSLFRSNARICCHLKRLSFGDQCHQHASLARSEQNRKKLLQQKYYTPSKKHALIAEKVNGTLFVCIWNCD